MSSPSRREVALASEDDTRGLADPPFQLWYETTFSSSLSTLNCSCTFCRRRLWHSVSGHCFPDQVRAVLDEPDPARPSFLIWSCPNVEFFFLLCIFHHRRSHLVFVAGEAVLSPNLHEAAVGAGSAVNCNLNPWFLLGFTVGMVASSSIRIDPKNAALCPYAAPCAVHPPCALWPR